MADTDMGEEITTAENPVTMEEWQSYVDGLSNDEELYEIAMAAGTIKFGEKLRGEGYPATDITAIRTMIARKLLEQEIAPPTRVGGCMIDYRALLPGQFTF